MKSNTTNILGAKFRPLYVGIFTVLAVMILGVGIAYATGMTQPAKTLADEFDMGDDLGGTDLGGLDTGIDTGVTDTGVDTGINDTVTSPDTGDTATDPTPATVTEPSDSTDLPTPTTPDTGDTAPCCTLPDTSNSTPTTVDVPEPAPVVTTPTIGDTAPCCTLPDTSAPVVDVPPTDVIPTTPDIGDTAPCCTLPDTTDTDVPTPTTTTVPTTPDTGDTAPCCTETDTDTPPAPPVETTPVITPPDTTPPPVVTPTCEESGTCTPIIVPPTCEQTNSCGSTTTPPVCTQANGCTSTTTPPTCTDSNGCTSTTTPPTPGCTSNCGGGGGGGSSGGSSGGIVYGGGGGVSGQLIAGQAYVSLSQIPYTGLDLGPIGTVVYWAALVIFCASAAYLVIFNIIPFFYKRITAAGQGVGHMLNSAPQAAMAMSGAHGGHGAPATHGPSHGPVAHSVAAPAAPALSQADHGFKAFAAQGSALTIDDIVKGLSRETGTPEPVVMPIPVEPQPVAPDQQVVPVSEAHTNAAPAPAAAPAYAPAPAPARAEAPVSAVSPDVRDFIAALINGDRDAVFGAIRQTVRGGGDAEAFLTQVVCALDDAYRARLDGTYVHPEIAALTKDCATSFLERLISSLTNAVDSSYSVGITGAKLAATRALAVVEG